MDFHLNPDPGSGPGPLLCGEVARARCGAYLPPSEEVLSGQGVQDAAPSGVSAKVSAGQSAQLVAFSLKVPACGVGCWNISIFVWSRQ